jgi:hypothetical protein
MVMMTSASHEFVDKRLREAAEGIEKAPRETAAKKGYRNLELAIRVIGPLSAERRRMAKFAISDAMDILEAGEG